MQIYRQNYISVYILFPVFLDSEVEDKRFYTERYQTFPKFHLLLISY